MSIVVKPRKIREPRAEGAKLPREKITESNGIPGGLPCAACGAWCSAAASLVRNDPDLLCGECSHKAAEGMIVYVDGKWKPAPPAAAVLSTVTPSGIAEHDPDVVKEPVSTLSSEGLKKLPEDWGITIDREFRDLLDPLEPIELQKLRSDIIVRGVIDPLIVWRCTGHVEGVGDVHVPRRILLDGHHRYQLAWEHRKPVAIKELEFASRAEALSWMRDHQVGRRNVTPEKRNELIAKDYFAQIERRKNGHKGQKNGKAADVIADKHQVSPATVKRAVASQRGKSRIKEATGDSGEAWSREEISGVSSLSADEYQTALSGGRESLRKAGRAAAAKKKLRDSRLNANGVYVRGAEVVTVPIPKSTRCHAAFELIKRKDGYWVYGYRIGRDGGAVGCGGISAKPRHEGERFADRHSALLDASKALRQEINKWPARARNEALAWIKQAKQRPRPSAGAEGELVAECRKLADRFLDSLADIDAGIRAWLEVGRQKLVENDRLKSKKPRKPR
jgi:hypothetical protein